jgi:tRNA dimethylallyltransferase
VTGGAPRRLVVTGPTASGKGALAAELARRLGGEIVSLDSMKVYRRMDIGTAKPSPALRREIPFHLVDIVDASESFSVGDYLARAHPALRDIEARARPVILQGGTALYLNALLFGLFRGPEADWRTRQALAGEAEARGLDALYEELGARDPEAAAKIYRQDRRRIVRALEVIRLTGRRMSDLWRETTERAGLERYACFAVGWERAALYRRIDLRVERMVDAGLFAEARALQEDSRALSRTASRCIGYRHVFEALASGEAPEATVARIQQDTRRFAKQQLTWFRRFPITWLAPGEPGRMADQLLATLARPGPP